MILLIFNCVPFRVKCRDCHRRRGFKTSWVPDPTDFEYQRPLIFSQIFFRESPIDCNIRTIHHALGLGLEVVTKVRARWLWSVRYWYFSYGKLYHKWASFKQRVIYLNVERVTSYGVCQERVWAYTSIAKNCSRCLKEQGWWFYIHWVIDTIVKCWNCEIEISNGGFRRWKLHVVNLEFYQRSSLIVKIVL